MSVSLNKATRQRTKRPEYDLPLKRGDKLVLSPLINHANETTENTNQPTILDLFCGAGGMSLGFEEAGFKVALGLDKDFWSCQTFAANIHAKAVVQDLEELDSDERIEEFLTQNGVHTVTGIIGGPPCQGFSRVGRGRIRHRDRLNGHREHQKDERNTLYRRFLAIVATVQPQFFVMENVPELDSYLDEDGEGMLADRIEAEFSEAGYTVERHILNAADFGVPQVRSRIFIIGLKNSLHLSVTWPDAQTARKLYGVQTLRYAIGDLPVVSDGHYARETPYFQSEFDSWLLRWYRKGTSEEHRSIIFDHITRPHREDDKEYFRMLQEGQKYIDLPEDCRRYRADIFKDKYRKLIWDEPSWTITAHIKRDGYRYIHPVTEPPRTISVRETARIQSFPDRWRFCGYRSNAFAQIGNAVPPLLSRAIAEVIMSQINGQDNPEDPLFAIQTSAQSS